MKKFTFLFSFLVCAMFMNAQVVFNETCGNDGKTENPRDEVKDYTGWDNGAPVTFSSELAKSADVRATNNMNTHVWFPAGNDVEFVIDNIPVEYEDDLRLSFDVATNYSGSDGDANVNKFLVYYNDEPITVPSVALTERNTYFSSGEISLPSASTIKLRFYLSANNNPEGYGYRLDNIRITSGAVTNLNSITTDAPIFYVSGNSLVVNNLQDGTMVEIYNALGAKVQTSFVVSNNVQLDPLAKGLYIVKAGKYTQKIMF